MACGDSNNYAPVSDAGSFERVPLAGIHRVRHGETLYEIAWRYGMDYRDLAAHNKMHSPYVLYSGQIIHLRNRNTQTAVSGRNAHDVARPVITEGARYNEPKPVESDQVQDTSEPDDSVSAWAWPAKGKIIKYFSTQNKGINIAGRLGEPVYAAASGKVVYSGEGLRGYGKLIILKHNSVYLSAYAHNNAVFVNEGDWVRRGQKIAEMGNSGTDIVMLHFEIRHAGKPVDPTGFYSTTY